MAVPVTATHLNYYHICKHKLWLFANGISMEHTSGLVYEGKVLHKTAYAQRPKKYREVQLGGSKIDYYDPKTRVIHETKRSDAMHAVDTWQIKYYIFLLEEVGISGVTGVIEYPYLREKKKVILADKDKVHIVKIIERTKNIMARSSPPRRVRKKICDRCAYFDFCWVGK